MLVLVRVKFIRQILIKLTILLIWLLFFRQMRLFVFQQFFFFNLWLFFFLEWLFLFGRGLVFFLIIRFFLKSRILLRLKLLILVILWRFYFLLDFRIRVLFNGRVFVPIQISLVIQFYEVLFVNILWLIIPIILVFVPDISFRFLLLLEVGLRRMGRRSRAGTASRTLIPKSLIEISLTGLHNLAVHHLIVKWIGGSKSFSVVGIIFFDLLLPHF